MKFLKKNYLIFLRWHLALQTPELAQDEENTSPQQASNSWRRGLTLTRNMHSMYSVMYVEAQFSHGVSMYGVVNRRGAQSPSPKALPLAREGLGFTSCHVRRTGARKVCPDSIRRENRGWRRRRKRSWARSRWEWRKIQSEEAELKTVGCLVVSFFFVQTFWQAFWWVQFFPHQSSDVRFRRKEEKRMENCRSCTLDP